MRISIFTSAVRKLLAASVAAALALGLMPALGSGTSGGGSYFLTASASEQEAPATPLPAGSISDDTQADTSAASDGAASDAAPEAAAQSASTHASDSGSAGGTTVSIQVYRSSFPIDAWVLLSPEDKDTISKPEWSIDPEAEDGILPKQATPGEKLELKGSYDRTMEPTRSGYLFAGWSTDPTDPKGGYIDSLVMPEGAPKGGSYTLYALWTPREYAVVIDLTQNPSPKAGPQSDESYDLNWFESAATSRKIVTLDAGRYLVSGFTFKDSIFDPDYDDATGLVALPHPKRTGYDFLGWAEPDGQGAVRSSENGYGINLVRLAQLEGAPVLTARWASRLGVTAPLSITFGDYDKTGAPGNPSLGDSGNSAASDTTQSEADDTETAGLTDQERYEGLGEAYFENTGWNDPIKMVAITSERYPSADQVLTTYDSSKASKEAVLGDGTDENPGERLLSLYPSKSTPDDKSTGVHFRLSDSLGEADLAKLPSIAAGAQQFVTYGLNLNTDPVTGSSNHGLVLPTDDYAAKQIATVSYTFTVDQDTYGDSVDEYCFTTIDDDGRTLSIVDIKADADLIAAGDAATKAKYERWMKADHRFTLRWYDKGVYELDGGLASRAYTEYPMRIIGINHDNKTSGGKAGLTFQMVGLLKQTHRMHSTSPMRSGWRASDLRASMSSGAIYAQSPVALRRIAEPVEKLSNNSSAGGATTSWAQGAPTPTTDRFFVASFHEQLGDYSNTGVNAPGTGATGWLNSEGDQYEYWIYRGVNGESNASQAPLAKGSIYWQRTYALRSDSTMNCVGLDGLAHSNLHSVTELLGVPICFCF